MCAFVFLYVCMCMGGCVYVLMCICMCACGCVCACIRLPRGPLDTAQYRPALEELRAGYYREMKKFISIPSVFAGFGNTEVFAPMADRNAASLTQVYRKVGRPLPRSPLMYFPSPPLNVQQCICYHTHTALLGNARVCVMVGWTGGDPVCPHEQAARKVSVRRGRCAACAAVLAPWRRCAGLARPCAQTQTNATVCNANERDGATVLCCGGRMCGGRRYLSWVALGQVADLDTFVETHVTTVADWDANFKMLKVRW
jgi:hypothetical protein